MKKNPKADRPTGTFDGWLIQYIFLSLWCTIITIITAGLGFPAAICLMKRWECKHTVYDGHRLYFDGKGIQLLGNWIKWWFLALITAGIYLFFIPIRVAKWSAKHTHLRGYESAPAVYVRGKDGAIKKQEGGTAAPSLRSAQRLVAKNRSSILLVDLVLNR